MTQPTKGRYIIYISTCLLSAILSVYTTAASDLVNKDGILYLNTAKAFLEGGLADAYASYSWPFYSFIIALIHKLSGLDMTQSASLINAFFIIVASITFIRIYEVITAGERSLLIPMLFILMLPILNEYRAYTIRGPGFWAFMLIAILFFLSYIKQPSIKNAAGWQLCGIIATLFRVEGIAFLLLAPLYFPLIRWEIAGCLRHFIKLYAIPATLFVGTLLIYLATLTRANIGGSTLGHLSYLSPAILLEQISNTADQIRAIMPLLSSDKEAIIIMTSGLLTLLAYKLFFNLQPLFVLISGYGIRHRWVAFRQESGVILFFAAISLLTLLVVAWNQFFISSRFTIFTVILLSLISCQYVDRAIQWLIKKGDKRLLIGMAAIVLALFLDSIISTGAHKDNIITAAKWSTEQLQDDDPMVCNEPRLAYYSNNRCHFQTHLYSHLDDAKLDQLQTQGYRHLMLWVKKKNSVMRDTLDQSERLTFVKAFANKKGDEVRIYALSP